MEENQHIWQEWAKALHRWGVQDWAASFLEEAGPLNVLGAQVIYIIQPWFNQEFSGANLDRLAKLLEDNAQTRSFAAFLREEREWI